MKSFLRLPVELNNSFVAFEECGANTSLPVEGTFYIRSVYPVLYDKIMAAYAMYQAADNKQVGQGVWITGTPQIGKSTFMFYVIRKLRDEKALDIVVTIGKLYRLCRWYNNRLGLYDRVFDKTHNKKHSLSKESTIHLIDPDTTTSMFIEEEKAFTVFFTSTHSNIEPYQLRKMLTLYMPTWDKEELKECCEYLEWNEEQHMDYYEKWGGIILNEYSAFKMEGQLCYNLKLAEDLMKLLLAVDPNPLPGELQWLIHRRPTCNEDGSTNYSDFLIDFPSLYVKNEINKKLQGKPLPQSLLDARDGVLLNDLYKHNVMRSILIPGKELFVENASRESHTLEIKHQKSCKNNDIIEEPEISTLYSLEKRDNCERGDAVFIMTETAGLIIHIMINKKPFSCAAEIAKNNFPTISEWDVCFITLMKKSDFHQDFSTLDIYIYSYQCWP